MIDEDPPPWEPDYEPAEHGTPEQAFPPQPGATVFDYVNADGSPSFKVVRREAHNGHAKKTFTQWSVGATGWEPRQHIPKGQRPLFNLPVVLANSTAKVLVVEGEKKAVHAATFLPHGWVITAWSGGSIAVDSSDWSSLAGREVTIWPDNDAPGFQAAADLLKILPTLRKVNVPLGFPDKWDLANPPPEGWDIARLMGLLNEAPGVEPSLPEPPASHDKTITDQRQILDIGDWEGIPVEGRKWIVDDLIPCNVVTMLTGDGGLGKSTLALQLAIASAANRKWLGRPVKSVKVLIVACEDDEEELHRRCDSILQREDMGFADLAGLIRIVPGAGLDNVLVDFEDYHSHGAPTEFFDLIFNEAKELGAQLVILDSLHDLFAGNENLRPQARQFINQLRRIAMEINGAVLLLAHPSVAGLASGDGRAGSTAWHNTVRSRLYLTEEKEPDQDPRLVLKNNKSNYGPRGTEIALKYDNGVFVATNPPSTSDPVYKKAHADTTFLDLLRDVTKQGRSVTDSKNAGNYAPKIFAATTNNHGFSRSDFANAMERLFSEGRLKKAEVKGADRHKYISLVEVQKGSIRGAFGDVNDL